MNELQSSTPFLMERVLLLQSSAVNAQSLHCLLSNWVDMGQPNQLCVKGHTDTVLCPPTVTAIQTDAPAWNSDLSLSQSKEKCGAVQNVDSHATVLTCQVTRQLTSSDDLQNIGMRAVVTCTEGQNVSHKQTAELQYSLYT
jgi:hypothetical protein